MAKPFKTSNGVEIPVKGVSLLLTQDIAKSFPAPEPTKVSIERPDGTFAEIADSKSQEYRLKVIEHMSKLDGLLSEIVLLDGCDFELDESQVEKVDVYRKRMAQRGKRMGNDGIVLHEDDKYVYIAYLLVPDTGELRRLTEYITGLNQATKEEMAKAQDNFRRLLEG